MTNELQRAHVLGVPVDAVTMAQALDYAESRIGAAGRPAYIIAMNPEKVCALRKNPGVLAFVRGAGLLIPDGIGVVLALRLLHRIRVPRLPGADFMEALCARASARGWPVFFYGATEEVSVKATAELQRRYPGLRVAGRSNGYVPADEMDAVIDRINASGASLLFVALGSPRQEEWLQRHLPRLKVPICQGIGGTLDTLAGTVKRAPPVFQALNLEWFFRLLRQPSRAGRQRVLVRFAWDVFRESRQSRARAPADSIEAKGSP